MNCLQESSIVHQPAPTKTITTATTTQGNFRATTRKQANIEEIKRVKIRIHTK